MRKMAGWITTGRTGLSQDSYLVVIGFYTIYIGLKNTKPPIRVVFPVTRQGIEP